MEILEQKLKYQYRYIRIYLLSFNHFQIRPQKILLLPEMRVAREIFTWAASNNIFSRFCGDLLFSYLVSFAF